MSDPSHPNADLGAILQGFLERRLLPDEQLALVQLALETAIPAAQAALAAIKIWRSYGPGGPLAPAPTGLAGGTKPRGQI